MLDAAIRYYGFDWAAMTLTFLSIYRLGARRRDGFLFGLGANVCWSVFGIMAGSIANPLANAVFLVLNLRGYARWRRAELLATPPEPSGSTRERGTI